MEFHSWKFIIVNNVFSGMELNLADLTEVDRDYVPGLLCIRDMMTEGSTTEIVILKMNIKLSDHCSITWSVEPITMFTSLFQNWRLFFAELILFTYRAITCNIPCLDLVSMEMPFSTPSASGTEIALAPSPRGSTHATAPRVDQLASTSASKMDSSLNLMQTSSSVVDVITPENRNDYIRQGT